MWSSFPSAHFLISIYHLPASFLCLLKPVMTEGRKRCINLREDATESDKHVGFKTTSEEQMLGILINMHFY